MDKSARKAAPRKPSATVTTRKPSAKKTGAGLAPVLELSHEMIAARAYDLFVRSGHEHGRDIEFWLEAERELRRKA